MTFSFCEFGKVCVTLVMVLAVSLFSISRLVAGRRRRSEEQAFIRGRMTSIWASEDRKKASKHEKLPFTREQGISKEVSR